MRLCPGVGVLNHVAVAFVLVEPVGIACDHRMHTFFHVTEQLCCLDHPMCCCCLLCVSAAASGLRSLWPVGAW